MKVLVTGGCGFLGSHICELFRSKGWDVVAYDNLTKYELERTGYQVDASRRHNVDFLTSIGVTIEVEDVRDAAMLRRHAEGTDFIAHTAAQPAMTISWEDPRLDFESNAPGTFNVLEAARARGIPVASCSTIHTYGTGINDEIRESDTRYVREPAEIAESHAVLSGLLSAVRGSQGAAVVCVRA
jgi:CDP-paratose 2-epimerase